MVLNYIWIAFFVIAFLFGLVELCFMGNTEVFTNMVQATFDSSKTAFETSLGLTGVLALWLGIMKIGERVGASMCWRAFSVQSSPNSSLTFRRTILSWAPSS